MNPAEFDPSNPERDVPRLSGERVLLREWVPDDLKPFAELNADPRVMEHYPAPLTRAESDAGAGLTHSLPIKTVRTVITVLLMVVAVRLLI